MIEQDGAVLTVTVALTMTVARDVVEAGLPLLKGGEVIIDLGRVPAADSSALAVLYAWQRAQAAKGGVLRVRNVPVGLRSIAGAYGAEASIPGLVDGD